MHRHESNDTIVLSRELGGRVVRVVIPKDVNYRWPHVVTSEQSLEWHK